MEPSPWALLPPLAAIALALFTRRVVPSLMAGIGVGALLLAGGNPLRGVAAGIGIVAGVLADAGNLRLLTFCLLIGPLVLFTERSGGVAGFTAWLQQRRWVRGPRAARMLAWLIGIVVFIESNITLLVAGAVCRPLFDRHGESRERLAYLADSTSAPVCILIPFNAWGALVLGILQGLGEPRALEVFARAIPLNFYALTAVGLAGVTAWTGWSIGPMRRARPVPPAAADRPDTDTVPPGRPLNLLLPVFTLLATMPAALLITGGGVLSRGSGSKSALAAVVAGLLVAGLQMMVQRLAGPALLLHMAWQGAARLLPLVVVLLLAMALGAVCTQLGTGPVIASWSAEAAHPALLLPLTFTLAALVAFSTGTSWGTFAMVIPISVPAAEALGLPAAPFVAASLSGGIFGDHASPISDTTLVASLAAGTDVISHVRTQLPYALIAGAVSVVAFALLGLFLQS